MFTFYNNNPFQFQLQRTKAKSSSRPSIATLRKTNQYHRSAIDLPTTEPFLECYTSDCDECTENRLCTMKTPLRQSSRADGTAKSTEKGIPDELIITSAKRHESKSDTTDNDDKCRPSLVDELPAIKGPKRFNSAWSNMKRYGSIILRKIIQKLPEKIRSSLRLTDRSQSRTFFGTIDFLVYSHCACFPQHSNKKYELSANDGQSQTKVNTKKTNLDRW